MRSAAHIYLISLRLGYENNEAIKFPQIEAGSLIVIPNSQRAVTIMSLFDPFSNNGRYVSLFGGSGPTITGMNDTAVTS